MLGMAASPLLVDRTTKVVDAFLNSQMREAPLWASPLYKSVPSTTRFNKYPVNIVMPRMREWLGERIFKTISDTEFVVKNRVFEGSAEADVDDIADDAYNGYGDIGNQLARQARFFEQDLFLEGLMKGETTLGPDGQYFFDTDHPVLGGSGIYANLFTAKPLVSAGVPQYQNFADVLAAMQIIKGADDRPFGFGTDLYLVVPPALQWAARRIVESPIMATTNDSNPYFGAAKVLVGPDLATLPGGDSNSWYLWEAGGVAPAMLVQNREDPLNSLVTINAVTSDPVFLKNVVRWGLKGQGNYVYGMGFSAAKVKAT